MKTRFSKASITEAIEGRLESAMYQYKEAAGKGYDIHNGWAQVPKDNMGAAIAYGKIVQCEEILDDEL